MSTARIRAQGDLCVGPPDSGVPCCRWSAVLRKGRATSQLQQPVRECARDARLCRGKTNNFATTAGVASVAVVFANKTVVHGL